MLVNETIVSFWYQNKTYNIFFWLPSIDVINPLQDRDRFIEPADVGKELGALAEVPQQERSDAQWKCHYQGQEAPGTVHYAHYVDREIQLYY